MQLINLTRHHIAVYDTNDRPRLRLEVYGDNVPRVREQREIREYMELNNGLVVPIYDVYYQAPDNDSYLPDPAPNTYYVVPRLVADVTEPHRDDLIYPYEFTRNDAGAILGCRSFARFVDTARERKAPTPQPQCPVRA